MQYSALVAIVFGDSSTLQKIDYLLNFGIVISSLGVLVKYVLLSLFTDGSEHSSESLSAEQRKSKGKAVLYTTTFTRKWYPKTAYNQSTFSLQCHVFVSVNLID